MQQTLFRTFIFICLGFFTACSNDDGRAGENISATGSNATTLEVVDSTVESAVIEPTGPVIVYSSRQEHLIKPLFDRFTQETGIEVQYQTGEEGPLIARLQAEGEGTYADIFYTVDAGNLWSAANKGLLRPTTSAILEQNIPEYLRDSEGRWYGLSVRARTIAYSTERVDPSSLSTYAALADQQWQGKLCLRSSRKVYNMSLVASMIDRLGAEKTEQVVSGWVNNLATRVFNSDALLLEAIAAGQCDVGIVNTYYLGQLQTAEPDIPVALFWANQESSGVHVNISGAGVTKYARNPEGALRLLEWLSTYEPQVMFSELNLEYPASPAAPATELVNSWGNWAEINQDQINVEVAGRRQAEAVMLMDRADYR